MVAGKPGVQTIKRYGDEATYPKEPESVACTVFECTKGEPNVPVLVRNNDELYAAFGVRLRHFAGCGGKYLWGVRAAAGTPVKAKSHIMDTAETAVNVIDLTAKQKGTKPIYITVSNTGGASGINTIIVEEDGFQTEKYTAPATAQGNIDMVTKINNISQIVDAANVTAGTTFILATVTRGVLGVVGGGSPVAGSDGTIKAGATDGTLADADAPVAHRSALAALETVVDPMPGIVFTQKDLATVHAEYAAHSTNMNSDLKSKWRVTIIGGVSNATIAERQIAARAFNSEHIWYVGHSLLGKDDEIYTSAMLPAAIAGALAKTPYHESIWGGEGETVLGADDQPFFENIYEAIGDDDVEALNEAGVITFERDEFGVKVLETVTTATPAKAETDEDEGSVVRIVQRALRLVYGAGNKMKGKKMTETFNADLKKVCSDALDPMVTDGALIEDSNAGLKPYDIDATSIPRAKAKLGRADISIALTVAHAARKIFEKVVIK